MLCLKCCIDSAYVVLVFFNKITPVTGKIGTGVSFGTLTRYEFYKLSIIVNEPQKSNMQLVFLLRYCVSSSLSGRGKDDETTRSLRGAGSGLCIPQCIIKKKIMHVKISVDNIV